VEDRYDVIVIGGGVSGCSTAFFLASDPGFDGRILVVERDPTYQDAPSARATGGIRQQFSTPENVRIGLFGSHFVRNASDYLSIDGEAPDLAWREGGYLLLATPESLPVMRENNAVQRAEGADIALLTPPELERKFDWLNTDGLAGGCNGLSGEGWVDPYSLLQAFRRKARSLGVELVHDEALRVTRSGSRVESVTLAKGGEVRAGAVVNAAGASGVKEIAATVGVDLPIESRKRCTFVFECRERVEPVPLTILPEGIGFRPEGRTFLANRAPPPESDPPTRDTDIDHDLFEEHIWPALAARVPAFEAIKVTSAWCCHYDFNTLDENAIVGTTPGLDNFYVLAGFSGHGLQQSPAMGRATSELILHGEYRTLDLRRFGYERILAGEPLVEANCF
jgi:glycine/D-amino acid oxidase-like deaminating enzyme